MSKKKGYETTEIALAVFLKQKGIVGESKVDKGQMKYVYADEKASNVADSYYEDEGGHFSFMNAYTQELRRVKKKVENG